jgi:hypothetical protein
MELNELAQWSVLLLMAIFLVGLTRQLGRFLLPPSERRAEEWGPALGDRLPENVLTNAQRDRATELIRESVTGWAAGIVVSPACDACEQWLAVLRDRASLPAAPIITFVSGSNGDYVARVRLAADLVITDDPGRHNFREANLVATPFLMILDDQLTVRQKQLGGDPRRALEQWVEAQEPVSGSSP